MRARLITATAVVLAMLGAGFGAVTWNADAAQSAEDSYGYSYTDSKAPTPSVAFDWIEINGTGTDTGLSYYYEYVGPISIGFDFEFYGNVYSELYIATNGFVSFGYGSWEYWNEPIPDTWSPDNFVAAYWDELGNYDGAIYYGTVGVAPNRQMVIEWQNVSDYWGSSDMTFEIVLNETGDIWCQYLSLHGMTGSSATVGIEDSTGDVGTQYSYNTASLTDSLAIRFSEGPVSIGPDQAYLGMPGEIVQYSLTVTNRQSISDSFAITYTPDLGWPVVLYDSLMNPLMDTDSDLIPDTGTLAPYSSATIYVTVEIPMSPVSTVETTTVDASSHALPSNFDTCILTTEMIGAWFTPPHSDYGYDPETDGEYNYLIVELSVNVHVEDWYYFEGYLYTSTHYYLGSEYSYPYLAVGSQTVQLTFDGWPIRESGMDGPYHVDLQMYDSSWQEIDWDVHYTNSYAVTEFMETPGEFSSPFSDSVIDTEPDGLYDYLAIEVPLLINYEADFRVETYLYDSDWNYIGYEEVSDYLSVGGQSMQVLYDAWDISENAVYSGAFETYFYLYAYMDGVWVYLSSAWYATSSYDLSDFERPDASFEPPHSDYVTDGDLDGLYDYLVIEVGVDILVEGDYTVVGVLRADSWTAIIDTQTNTSHLAAGLHVVELWYPGWPIAYNSDSDDMDIELELRQRSTVLDTDWYTTDTYYYYWSFEDAPGELTPPYSESAVDLDGDLLYDYLEIFIPVTVSVAGTYQIYAELYYIWQIDEDSNATYLPVGTTVVELRFSGWIIRSEGWNGPYDVYLYLYDSGSREMDSDWFSTAAYAYTDFQTVPASFGWPHDVYVEDTDLDGDLDGMFLNVSVEVAVAGTFQVMAQLHDGSWIWVANTGDTVTLPEGTQTVYLTFPAWLIYAHGVDGTFRIDLYLGDAMGNMMDYDTVTTGIYYYADFDTTVPRIESGWASAAPVIDGVYSADEWADAAAVELTASDPFNEIDTTLLVMNDGIYLYIAYDVHGDTSESSDDTSSLAFDTGNDGVATDGHEDEFWLSSWALDSQGHMTYSEGSSWWVNHCTPFDDEGLVGAVGFGTSPTHAVEHRIFEYQIPLALLGTSAGDLIGFLAGSHSYDGVLDSYAWDESWWPALMSGTLTMDMYGEILLAEHIVIGPPTTTAIATGTAGTNGWYRSGVNVTLTATGGDGGVDYTEYRINGGAWIAYSSPVMFNADGTRTFEFRSVDNAAQVEATKTLTVRIDRVAPVTTSTVSSPYVWLNMTDATSGAGRTMYRIDGGAWGTYSGVLNISEEGTHTVEFYSVDAAGNAEATQSLEVEVEGEGQAGAILGDWTLYIVLAIIAIIAAISIGFIFGMKRKAKESDSKAAIKDIGTSVSQMMDEGPPKPPEGK